MSSLKDLVKDASALRAAVARAAAANPLPVQVSQDQADQWMAKIYNLFTGVDSSEVDIALCYWSMVNGVGGEDDFSTKPPIVAGGISVPATQVFGDIVPVGIEGTARKFASTMFESYVPAVLKAYPELQTALSHRTAKAGLSHGQGGQVIDFVKGVTSATVGLSGDRNAAKQRLIAMKKAGGLSPGTTAPKVPEVVDEGPVDPRW